MGSLVSADEVKIARALYKREFRDLMMAIPGTIAARVAELRDESEVTRFSPVRFGRR